MDSLRLDLRLSSQPLLGSRVIIKGAAGGRVFGAYIDPASRRIIATALPQRNAKQTGAEVLNEQGAQGALLEHKTVIQVGNKQLGKLSRIWAERDTGKLTHVLFLAGGNEHVVPVAHIGQLTAKHIQLDIAVSEAQALPVYRDDAAIAGDVGMALERVLLDPRSRRDVHARVEDGHVDLTGVVDQEELAEGILASIRRVPGVRGVQSDIIVTEDIATLVVNALDRARDKGSLGDDPEIEVLSEHQIVYLRGRVATPAASAAAQNAALGVAGVRLVVNELRVVTPETTERADPASPATKLK
jgi:osmotically-inducible protein OsmY